MHEISIDTIWYFHGLQTYAHTLYTMGWNNFWRIILISCTYLCFFVCLLLICPFCNWHLKYTFREHFGVHSNNTNFRITELWTFEPLDLFDYLFYLILFWHLVLTILSFRGQALFKSCLHTTYIRGLMVTTRLQKGQEDSFRNYFTPLCEYVCSRLSSRCIR